MLVSSASDQAKSNQIKNRGEPGLWFQHKADFREPQPNPRIRPEAREISEHNKPTIDEVFHNYQLKGDPEKVPTRLRNSEAVHIADKFKNQDDKWFDYEGNQEYRPPPRPIHAYPESNVELVKQIDQQHGHDWFDHTKKPEPVQSGGPRCTSQLGKEIANQMAPTRNVDWFSHDKSNAEAPARCGSRTRGYDAGEYAERNRQGSASDWMGRTRDPMQDNVQYGDRCPTTSAQINKAAAKGQSMKDCFNYTEKYVEPAPATRVKGGAAEENYMRNTRGTRDVPNDAPPPGPKVRSEAAEEIAERNKGQLGKWMDQGQNRDYNSPRPQPRARTEAAQAVAERNKGEMDMYLSKPEYQAPPHQHKTHQRANNSDVAKDLAEKSKGSAAKSLLESSSLPPETAPKARITGYGGEYADRNRGTAGMVITGMAPRDERTVGLRGGPAAADNAAKHRGSDLFKTIQQEPPSYRY